MWKEKEREQDISTLVTGLTLHERLMRRYNKAKTIADLWLSVLQASYFYAVPFRNRFYLPNKDFQGTMQNSRVYDTTAVEGTKTFVSKIQDTMTPPQVQWGFLEVDDTMIKDQNMTLEKLEGAQLVLDNYMRQLFNYLHASNFDVIVNECYFDLAIGTAALVINQHTDDKPFLFTSVPIDKLSIEEAANGKIESWFRTWEDLKISELHTRWNKIELSPELEQSLAANPDATVKLIYEGVAYFPNTEKPYLYAVWTNNSPLLYEWLDSNPGIVWRFQKTNNETWGRGPVMDALPTIISLNEMARIELAAANLNVFKPYMAFSDNVFNPHTFTLQPFSIIPIAPIGVGGSSPLIPLPGTADPQFSQMIMGDLRMQIKSLLYAESPSDAVGIQPQTAYELALRQQTLAQKIGPLFSRLQQEFLEPLIKRCSYILNSMGLLPFPDLDGIPIRFSYKSPLALAKGQEDVARLTHYVQLMQGIYGPEVTQVYLNPKTGPYLLANSLQVDPRWLNKPNDVQRVMQSLQNRQSMIDASAMTPQQPGNPSEQSIIPSVA